MIFETTSRDDMEMNTDAKLMSFQLGLSGQNHLPAKQTSQFAALRAHVRDYSFQQVACSSHTSNSTKKDLVPLRVNNLHFCKVYSFGSVSWHVEDAAI